MATEESNEDYKELQDYLDLQSEVVQQNCRIVSPEMMHCDFALHVDKNLPEEFVPRMPRSAMPSENDTCPRVSVAPTLIGCYVGYFRGERDLVAGSYNKPGTTDPFLGGYVISKVMFQHALLPNKRLVGDADETEELWLVNYSLETTSYVPTAIGKCFVSQLTYLPNAGHWPRIKLTLYVWHEEPSGLWLNKKVKLDPGYYRVNIDWPSVWQRSIHTEDQVSVDTVTKEEFEEHKQLAAALLSHAQELPNRPAFLNW